MNCLVDTHIIIWSLLDSPKLSADARNVLSSKTDIFYYSMASVWEVGIKHDLLKEDFSIGARDFADFASKTGYRLLNINVEHVEALSSLKKLSNHNDPFDRLMIAQAKIEGMKFITHDGLLSGYGESCIYNV